MFDNQGKNLEFRNVLYRGIIDQIVWQPGGIRVWHEDQSLPLARLAWSGKGDVRTPFWRGYEEE